MRKDWKEKWVKALRSGRYRQANGEFLSSDGKKHCCLAVLCRVLRAEKTKSTSGSHFSYGEIDIEDQKHLSKGVLPVNLRLAAGISVAKENRLVVLNDGKMWTFPKIADWVEKHL